jgi:enamine deaminase RidA (YjgF/YER057c/UK114 family)
MRQALANLRTLIERAGGTLDNIVQVTTLVADQRYARSAQTAWAGVFPDPDDRPAFHLMEFGLPRRDNLVQVHAIAAF